MYAMGIVCWFDNTLILMFIGWKVCKIKAKHIEKECKTFARACTSIAS